MYDCDNIIYKKYTRFLTGEHNTLVPLQSFW